MDTKILKISNSELEYEVGKDYIVSIDPSNQGPKRLTMYKVTYADDGVLFVGLTEHEVGYSE